MNNHFPLFIQKLANPALYPHSVKEVKVIETHISWVLLTGLYAYKIKKPVDLGFLDFSTLEKRHFYCMEELRLNRRLAPEIYLEVVPICGSQETPHLIGTGPVFEYAVKMVQFPEQSRLDKILANGMLGRNEIDDLVTKIADFHKHIAIAEQQLLFGTPEFVAQPVTENYQHIRPLLTVAKDIKRLDGLSFWSEQTFKIHFNDFQMRKQKGCIRECHGDLHLENIATLNGKLIIFDCIEFSEKLRWIDVISEIAFLAMDLEDRGQRPLAHRFINAYLEITGDYDSLKVINYYLVYRAMVRAKVAIIRLQQNNIDDQQRVNIFTLYNSYISLAEQYTKLTSPTLIITHGLSGSGKSTLSEFLVEELGAIRIRSDVERKRLFMLSPNKSSNSDVKQGIYTESATEMTYQRMEDLSNNIVGAGFSVVVDATFLKYWQRNRFFVLATRLHIPFVILDLQAEVDNLKQFIIQRKIKSDNVSEADFKVLEQQIVEQEPLTIEEQSYSLSINANVSFDKKKIVVELVNKLTGFSIDL